MDYELEYNEYEKLRTNIVKICRDTTDSIPRSDIRTHWETCYRHHPECLSQRIVEMCQNLAADQVSRLGQEIQGNDPPGYNPLVRDDDN